MKVTTVARTTLIYLKVWDQLTLWILFLAVSVQWRLMSITTTCTVIHFILFVTTCTEVEIFDPVGLYNLWSCFPFFITFMALGPSPLYSNIKKNFVNFFYRHSKCEAFASFASIALRSCLYMHPAARSLHIYPGIKRNW